MSIKSFKNIKKIKGRKIFLRLDLNVPLAKGKIKDDYRIRASLETIEFLSAAGARLIIASHLGDPAGRRLKALSLGPVALRLKSLLGRPVKFVSEAIGPRTRRAVNNLQDGQTILLENLRFYRGEYDNDPSFAAELAALADLYINDAFAVSHRNQASVSALKKLLPSYAGLLLLKEVAALEKLLKPVKPLIMILGGAKIATKAPLISRLYSQSDRILIGGALANSFFQAEGLKVGRSLVDPDSAPVIKKFLKNKALRRKIILPLDLVVKKSSGRVALVLPDKIEKQDEILDIGPATIAVFSLHIKRAKTMLWNGPMGKFEDRRFKHGTLAVGSLFAARSSGLAYGVAGGGETIDALAITGMAEYVDWVSTAGGAMLSYVGGAKMPGLAGLVKK